MMQYEQYRDSGSTWIGNIPTHWKLTKAKHCSSFRMGQTILKEEVIDNGEFPVYSATEGDHYFGRINNPLFLLEPGDIVIPARGNSIGHIALVHEKAVSTQTTIASFIDSQKINSNFLYYYYKGFRNILFRYDVTAIPQITIDQVKQNPIVLPPLEEQTKIAQYLDHQTAIIDQLILQKEKLIELLKEKRQAVINEAVTKGLNPNAKMKDSGIEWLGKVPEHWKIKKIKHIKSKAPNSFVDGPFGSNLKSEHFIEGGEVYVVESGFITTGIFEQKREFKTISHEHYLTIDRSSCKGGDIIIAKIGANYGMSGILPELDKPAVVSGNSLKLTVDTTKYVTEFIHFFLLNLKLTGSLEVIVNATAQPALSLGTLNDVAISVPPFEEQKQISVFIQNTSRKNGELTNALELQIEKLKEYRQSIISEAVTGKIDVRDWQPNKQQVA